MTPVEHCLAPLTCPRWWTDTPEALYVIYAGTGVVTGRRRARAYNGCRLALHAGKPETEVNRLVTNPSETGRNFYVYKKAKFVILGYKYVSFTKHTLLGKHI